MLRVDSMRTIGVTDARIMKSGITRAFTQFGHIQLSL
jgi:hypothetical protein